MVSRMVCLSMIVRRGPGLWVAVFERRKEREERRGGVVVRRVRVSGSRFEVRVKDFVRGDWRERKFERITILF